MATDQQFCLRWNNHQSTLISVFDTLLENGTLVDCTLAAEGQYLKAHKVVLSACSPYLETLLSQHYEKHPIVILKDVKFTELKSMMDYMYRGEVNISQDQLGTFLKAAESLQIKGLTDSGDDARDVGSTPAKRQDSPIKPTVTPVRNPVESKRPAPGDLSDASRDGSISPSSLRKRRRTRRPSQGDDPDSHLDTTNNSCDLNIQAQSTPLSVPNTTIVPTPVQNLPKQIVKQEPSSISRIDSMNSPIAPESGLLKEKIEPPSEPLLEPKTEYLDYMNNENSPEVEDLTLDDDDEDLDSSMDASRPGPSHGDMSNQGYPPWSMTGDQTGTDEIFMAAQEAVGVATGQQRDSQEEGGANMESSEVEVLTSPTNHMNTGSSSPEGFAGFSPSDINKPGGHVPQNVCEKKILSSPSLFKQRNDDRDSARESVVRIGQPRTSKSKAFLVWQKTGRQKEETIKDKPEDNSTKNTVGNKKMTTLNRAGPSTFGRGKRMKKPKTVEDYDEPNYKINRSIQNDNFVHSKKILKGELTNDTLSKGKNEFSTQSSLSIDFPSSSSTSSVDCWPHGNKIKIRPKRRFKKTPKKCFRCDKCGRSYQYLRGMRQHQKLECGKEPQFPCPYCPSRYRYRQGIREHVRNYHEQAFPKWYATHYVVPLLMKENLS